MKSFFQKLERAANRWVSEFDGQIEQPMTQVMTGEVFTHQAQVTVADATSMPDTHPTATPTSGLSQRVDKNALSGVRSARVRPTGMVTNQ